MIEYKGYYIKPFKGRYKVGTLEFDIMGTFPTIKEAKEKVDELEQERNYLYEKLFRQRN